MSDEIVCHKGTLRAKADQRLVSIFLSTCEKGHAPDVTGALNKLGWFNAQFFQLTTRHALDERRIVLFRAASAQEAIESMVRYISTQLHTVLISVDLLLVEINEVEVDGTLPHEAKGRLFQWSNKHHLSLRDCADQAIVELSQ